MLKEATGVDFIVCIAGGRKSYSILWAITKVLKNKMPKKNRK